MMICSICPASAFTRPSAGFRTTTQLDVLTDQPLKQLFRARDDCIEVEHFGLQHLLAAEGQKLARQQGGTITRFLDFFDTLALGIIRTQIDRA